MLWTWLSDAEGMYYTLFWGAFSKLLVRSIKIHSNRKFLWFEKFSHLLCGTINIAVRIISLNTHTAHYFLVKTLQVFYLCVWLDLTTVAKHWSPFEKEAGWLTTKWSPPNKAGLPAAPSLITYIYPKSPLLELAPNLSCSQLSAVPFFCIFEIYIV